MPKIHAATVAEHREAQRLAILRAATEIVLAGGTESLKFGDLADRAGLARPSIYEYFRSKSELFVALIEREAPALLREISSKMDGIGEPEEALATFIRALLGLIKAGRHELLFALAESNADHDVQHAMAKAHHEVFAIVVPALRKLEVRDIPLSLELVGGLISATVRALRREPKRRGLIEATVGFALEGVKSMSR